MHAGGSGIHTLASNRIRLHRPPPQCMESLRRGGVYRRPAGYAPDDVPAGVQMSEFAVGAREKLVQGQHEGRRTVQGGEAEVPEREGESFKAPLEEVESAGRAPERKS